MEPRQKLEVWALLTALSWLPIIFGIWLWCGVANANGVELQMVVQNRSDTVADDRLRRLAEIASSMTGMTYAPDARLPRAISFDQIDKPVFDQMWARWERDGFNHGVDMDDPFALFYGGTILHHPESNDALMAHEMTHWLQKLAGHDYRSHTAERQAECVQKLFSSMTGETEYGHKPDPGVCSKYW